MESVELIKLELAHLRRQVESVLTDMTEEQFNWNPPGTANSIRAALVHLIATEDYYIQKIIHGGERIWDQQQWSEKVGISAPPSASRGWDEIHAARLKLGSILAYAQAVQAATSAVVDGLTASELDRKVVLYGQERSVAEVFNRFFIHSALHAGEIAAVRGLQGVKGLPV